MKSSRRDAPRIGVLKLYRVFGRHYRPHLSALAVAYGGLLLTVVVMLLAPWPIKLILDHVILRLPLPPQAQLIERWVGSSPGQLLIIFTIAFVMLRLLDVLATYIHKLGLMSVGERIYRDVRNRVFMHLQRLPLSFHGSSRKGDLVYRLASDVTDLKVLLVEVPDTFFYRVLTFASHAVLMFVLEWRLALVAFMVIPILFAFGRQAGSGVEKAAKRRRRTEGEMASVMLESVQTMALIQAYGREDLQQSRFRTENQKSLESGIEAMRLSKMFKRTADLLMAVGACGVAWLGGWLALRGEIAPGTLILFVAYLKTLYSPVDKLAAMMLDIAGARASAERLIELIEDDSVIVERPGAVSLAPIQGTVSFENVTFGYREGEPVLRDISFTVAPGQRVALVGRNGAGKSTLISLLLRFNDPQTGCVRIDDHDLRDVTLASLRSGIAVVLQEARLFNRTVRENISFGKADAREEEIIHAAQQAEAHAFIAGMPNGYDTTIAEGGDTLSGGERQRINIARAMVRNAPIVILDEPSTALDGRTEARVRAAIHRLTDGRTTFLVAHQPTTWREADLILYLEKGRLAASGTHAELMERAPGYQALYESHSGVRPDASHGKHPAVPLAASRSTS